MSTSDKAGNTGDKVKGKAKEGLGKVVGNERLEAEGRADQVESDAKQAGEKAKDAVRDILKD
ncbi:CsbD family protein [Streptomyces sp. SID625]|nr:CsbD family protein [Streptomyces sp. SID625]